MSSAILQEVRFAKRSGVGSGDIKLLRFADAQESRFQGAKRPNMGNLVLQCGRLATSHVRVFCSETF